MTRGNAALKWIGLLAASLALLVALRGWSHHCEEHRPMPAGSAQQALSEDCAICDFQAAPFLHVPAPVFEATPMALPLLRLDLPGAAPAVLSRAVGARGPPLA